MPGVAVLGSVEADELAARSGEDEEERDQAEVAVGVVREICVISEVTSTSRGLIASRGVRGFESEAVDPEVTMAMHAATLVAASATTVFDQMDLELVLLLRLPVPCTTGNDVVAMFEGAIESNGGSSTKTPFTDDDIESGRGRSDTPTRPRAVDSFATLSITVRSARRSASNRRATVEPSSRRVWRISSPSAASMSARKSAAVA